MTDGRSPLLTNSRLRVARACQREHHIRYGLGFAPVATAAEFRFGTLVHGGLEAWWRAKMVGLPVEAWLAEALVAMAEQGESDPFEMVKAQVLLTGYHLRWVEEPYEVLGVEQQFDCPLRNPQTGHTSRTWRLAGKLDVVVRDLRDGLVKLMEHKTSSEDVSSGSDYWKRLRLDGQVSAYFEGAASLGYDVAECIYDVLAKPQQRPGTRPLLDEKGMKIVLDADGNRVRTANGRWRQTGDTDAGYVLQTRDETPEEYRERIAVPVAEHPERFFSRGVVVRLESEMQDALWDIWQLGQQIREAELANRFPKNPDACVRYGRTCPYFALCSGEASLDDERLFRRLESVHPELAEEPAHAPA